MSTSIKYVQLECECIYKILTIKPHKTGEDMQSMIALCHWSCVSSKWCECKSALPGKISLLRCKGAPLMQGGTTKKNKKTKSMCSSLSTVAHMADIFMSLMIVGVRIGRGLLGMELLA